MKKNMKGFTLIELLVVIAIIAILSVVVILTLNPAELLKQARDSSRVSDLSTLKTSLGTYMADVSIPSLGANLATNCNTSAATSSAGQYCGFTSSTYLSVIAASSSRAVDGTGWLPVRFTDISAGSPIGNLPVDPLNTGTNVYRYAATSTSVGMAYEINADLESAKQTNATGVEQTDGGNNTGLYEVGTVSGLAM